MPAIRSTRHTAKAEDKSSLEIASRACDVCRRKKRKCTGSSTKDAMGPCARCVTTKLDCTYIEDSKPRAPPKAYVQALEARCAMLEEHIRKLDPTFDIDALIEETATLDVPSTEPDSPKSSTSRPLESNSAIHQRIKSSMGEAAAKDMPWKYHGRSSLYHLFLHFNKMRDEAGVSGGFCLITRLRHTSRQDRWTAPLWESACFEMGAQWIDLSMWPDDQLAIQLIEAYFDRWDIHLPVLRQSTFLVDYHSGRYRSDHHFLKLCLLVFANGSRFVQDPRVLWEPTSSRHSAGWRYFETAQRMGPKIPASPTLSDLQSAVLTCTFLEGNAAHHWHWLQAGAALRAAQELGGHASNGLHVSSLEKEQLNRVFWCLYHQDIWGSALAGRVPVYRHEDFDIALPEKSGDEDDYKMSVFRLSVQLDMILAETLSTVFQVRPSDRSVQPDINRLKTSVEDWLSTLVTLPMAPTHSRPGYELVMLRMNGAYARFFLDRAAMEIQDSPQARATAFERCAVGAMAICDVIRVILAIHTQTHSVIPYPLVNPALAAFVTLQNYKRLLDATSPFMAGILAALQDCFEIIQRAETNWRQAGKFSDFILVYVSGEKGSDNTPSEGTLTTGVTGPGTSVHSSVSLGSDRPVDIPERTAIPASMANESGQTKPLSFAAASQTLVPMIDQAELDAMFNDLFQDYPDLTYFPQTYRAGCTGMYA